MTTTQTQLRLANRMSRLGTETAFEVLVRARALERQGRNIIHLEIGEPDMDTPANVVEAGVDALRKGFTHYGPAAGLPELREAIAAEVASSRGIKVSPDEVVVVPGGKPIIFFTMLALVEEGDEVIYPNPGFPIYESMINFLGAKAVPIPLREERDFRLDVNELASLISDRTKLIILNSPQNPTGGIITKSDVQDIAAAIGDRDIMVLSDEIYSRLLFEGEPYSIASVDGFKDRTIILTGFSKTYSMTGWRLGYGVMRPDLAAQFARLMTNSNFLHGDLYPDRGHRGGARRPERAGEDAPGVSAPPRRVRKRPQPDQGILLPVAQGRVLHLPEYQADRLAVEEAGRRAA